MSDAASFDQEVASGERFEFGRNWTAFLSTVTEAHIDEAVSSLRQFLDRPDLTGQTFVDVGCGSGLSSLAAVRLGASRVHSFDFDPLSVTCTQEMRRRFAPDSAAWTVERGSVLDQEYLANLGSFDVVYSWGVLHHTGAMWRALGNVRSLVERGGTLFIAIYNDQGIASNVWMRVKRIYNRSAAGRALVVAVYLPYFVLGGALVDVTAGRSPLRRYTDYKKSRGMSRFHDLFDWLGGYPFEVAKPEQILDFYRRHGFELVRLRTCGGKLGCNEFVFRAKA
jgi:2-polyprenyl-3-methyl-5-hydroxy-6-metoxy-1,4-benzoquinol methylase